MKKLVTISVLYVLFLMNAFASNPFDVNGDPDKMKQIAKDLKSSFLINLVNEAIQDCPDLVETVIKEQQKDLTLDQINTMNQRVLKLLNWLENITAEIHDEFEDEQLSLIVAEITNECSNYGINLQFSEEDNEKEEGNDCSIKPLVECLIQAYSQDLVSNAEEKLSNFIKEEL